MQKGRQLPSASCLGGCRTAEASLSLLCHKLLSYYRRKGTDCFLVKEFYSSESRKRGFGEVADFSGRL